MRRQPVASTTLLSAGYDAAERILELEFTSSLVYQYFDVPAKIFKGLMQADSKGSYFNDCIREKFEYIKVRKRR